MAVHVLMGIMLRHATGRGGREAVGRGKIERATRFKKGMEPNSRVSY